jgi:hypothetical protein
MGEEFEPVHGVEDYYDGPRTGVADFRGVPHRFCSLGWVTPDGPDGPWDPNDDRFELRPVSDPAAPLVVARGEFRFLRRDPALPPGVLGTCEVRWIPESEA